MLELINALDQAKHLAYSRSLTQHQRTEGSIVSKEEEEERKGFTVRDDVVGISIGIVNTEWNDCLIVETELTVTNNHQTNEDQQIEHRHESINDKESDRNRAKERHDHQGQPSKRIRPMTSEEREIDVVTGVKRETRVSFFGPTKTPIPADVISFFIVVVIRLRLRRCWPRVVIFFNCGIKRIIL